MDNQAIQLTAPGSAAIAVVRMLGPGVSAFLSAHFSKTPQLGRCVHGIITDGQRVIDDPVIALLPNGGADINLHGGPWVVRSMLDLARANGFSIIDPASHMQSAPQAVDGHNEVEKEIAAYLPLARTELAIRVLLAQADAWAQLNNDASREQIGAILADRSLYHLLHPPAVAIIGAPNVGKSTMANQLFGQERSITADIAGTTRDWIGEIANVDGLPVMLVDTPGQRVADDAIEQAAIAGSTATIAAAQLIILVLDANRPLEPDQSHLIADYPQARIVANKCDRPWAWEVGRSAAIQTTATTGAGLDIVRHAIAAHFNCDNLVVSQIRCWTERQQRLLEETTPDQPLR